MKILDMHLQSRHLDDKESIMNNAAVTDLEEFLAYLGKKGLLTPAAASSRRAAVGKIFAVLTQDERGDVFAVDIDSTINRFVNLHGKKYTPGSVQAYASRLRASIDDFRRYVEDPVNFKISGSSGAKNGKVAPQGQKKGKSPNSSALHAPIPSSAMQNASPIQEAVFPIPIRENLVVKIYGLPFDLSEGEANKIAAVIKAMAT
jgi:hypothetical protein